MRAFANKIYRGKDNPVIIDCTFDGEFAADGLSNFNRIQVDIGGESYNTADHPAAIFAQSNTQLRVKIGDLTQLAPGTYTMVITGFTAVEYDDGYQFPYFGEVEVI